MIKKYNFDKSDINSGSLFFSAFILFGIFILVFSLFRLVGNSDFKAIFPFAISLCFIFFGTIEYLELKKKTKIVFENDLMEINIIGVRKLTKKSCKRDGIKEVLIVREGVDKDEGPDSFPRYSVVVMKDKGYKIVGPYKRETIYEFGKSLAKWAKADLIDTKQEYVEYMRNWNEI